MKIENTVRIFQGDSRCMADVPDSSVGLVVTSPPYWQIKDYGTAAQIGYGQSLHDYLKDLARVWAECTRVLLPGRRLCVNIGDQFARATVYGRYKVIPLHAEVIAQAAAVGLDYLGSIIWQKKTTMNTTGGAVIMGSFPHPPNGIVELDYEYILLFKKPGESSKPTPEQKAASALTKDEWKQYFAGHWHFGGARQTGHEAMFPDELPLRLIRMFSFAGETVLDPFLGSGTTAKVAADLNREAIGYEINPDYLPLIREKMGLWPIAIERQRDFAPVSVPLGYVPHVENARPLQEESAAAPVTDETHKIVEIIDEMTLRTDSGKVVTLLGLIVPPAGAGKTQAYLKNYLLGKKVILRYNIALPIATVKSPIPAYVQLTNKLFINRKMIEMGLALADRNCPHRFQKKFVDAEMAYRATEKTT
jgi:modification methylase